MTFKQTTVRSVEEYIARAQAIFGPAPSRVRDRAAATYDYMEQMFAAGTDDLAIHTARQAYADALREIDLRWAEPKQVRRAA